MAADPVEAPRCGGSPSTGPDEREALAVRVPADDGRVGEFPNHAFAVGVDGPGGSRRPGVPDVMARSSITEGMPP